MNVYSSQSCCYNVVYWLIVMVMVVELWCIDINLNPGDSSLSSATEKPDQTSSHRSNTGHKMFSLINAHKTLIPLNYSGCQHILQHKYPQ